MIIDTNVVIFAIRPEFETLRDYLDANRSRLRVFQITKIETLGFHKLTTEDRTKFEFFFKLVPSFALSEQICNEAIRLRQQRKRSLGDAINAATALLHRLPPLTNNLADFADVVSWQVISLQSIRYVLKLCLILPVFSAPTSCR